MFTAIGMCWSGFLSTHTAMLDSLGYRDLTPKAILAHTVKGKGVSFMENQVGWHGKAPNAEQRDQALKELEG